MGLKIGLLVAQELEIKQLDVRVDSQICANLLSKNEHVFGPNQQFIHDCKKLITCPCWVVTISHVYRETN